MTTAICSKMRRTATQHSKPPNRSLCHSAFELASIRAFCKSSALAPQQCVRDAQSLKRSWRRGVLLQPLPNARHGELCFEKTTSLVWRKPAAQPLNNLFSGCLVVPFIPICLVVSLADPRRDFPELSKKQRNIMETRIQFKDLNSEVPATNCH